MSRGRKPVRAGTGPYWQAPELARDDRVIAGVAAGIAREIGIEPPWVRVAFVALSAAGGVGAILYAAIWGLLELDSRVGWSPPVEQRVPKGAGGISRSLGFFLVVSALFLVAHDLGGFAGRDVWALTVLGVGIQLVWHRTVSDAGAGSLGGWRLTVPALGLASATIALVVLFLPFARYFDSDAPVVLTAGVVTALVAGSAPWLWRAVRQRDSERQALARSEERADVAAHLHDSVLQTLSLIQRNSDDPRVMVNLARRQERELRNWLDPDRVSRHGGSVRGRLDDIAGDVEQLHGVPVEVVAVGDLLVDQRIDALLAATREAAVNAAKHAGTDQIHVYAEMSDTRIEVFVRDTGKGFDPDTIAEDRHGVRRSIIGRMTRAGGAATITSRLGEGTEVELILDLEAGR